MKQSTLLAPILCSPGNNELISTLGWSSPDTSPGKLEMGHSGLYQIQIHVCFRTLSLGLRKLLSRVDQLYPRVVHSFRPIT